MKRQRKAIAVVSGEEWLGTMFARHAHQALEEASACLTPQGERQII